MATKLKVVRVVTASYVVPWHLHNTLKRISKDFEVCVIGQGVSKNQVAYPDVKFVDININRKVSLIDDSLALLAMCRFFIVYKPDIVHSIMPKAGLLAAIAGFFCRVPVRMHTFTGQIWVAQTGLLRHFYYWIDRLINAMNTACLTDSFSQSAFLLENGIGHAGKPLAVLSKGSLSGVDVERFRSAKLVAGAEALRSSLGISREDFVFSFIARKTVAKGAVDVLKAFSAISTVFKNARLLFVGPDEDGAIAVLQEKNPELFVNVISAGHVSDPETYLAITDVLCLPSYREGFGSIVIDAAAMGVPAIGSRIPGLTDSIVENETGLLFPAGDVEALVKHMSRLIESPALRQQMGDRARTRVDAFFTADQLYLALKEFYMACAVASPAMLIKK